MPKGAKLFAGIALCLGIMAVLALAVWQGFDTIAQAFVSLGPGFPLLLLIMVTHIALAAGSWVQLFLPGRGPKFRAAFQALWVGVSVDTLVPLASMGGEIVKARLLMQSGVAGVDAVSSVVMDKTVQAVTIVLWGLTGALTLLLLQAGDELVVPVILGAGALAAGVAGFVAVQVSGAAGGLTRRAAARGSSPKWAGLVDSATNLDKTLRALYSSGTGVLRAVVLRYSGRLVLALELWIIAQFMGLPLSPLEALALRSVIGALRGVAFFIPSGWGLQEGGYILLGGLFGLPPDETLALSLIARAREIIAGIIGMGLWQRLEGRSWRSRLAGNQES